MSRLAVLLMFCGLIFSSDVRSALLSGSFVPRDPGTTIDLTTTGALDWVHWGYDSTNANRKWSGPIVGDLATIGQNAALQVTNSVEFSWTDGTPFATATNVSTSIAVSGLTNGFSLQMPADTSLKKLRIFVGSYAAEGRLQISLNDGITPAYIDSSVASTSATNGCYLVDLAADKNNDVLTIAFTATALHEANGYVSLQAVALATNAAPSITLTSPSNEANLVFGTPTEIAVSAFDSDGSVTNVEYFADGIKIGEAALPPYSISWTSTNSGPRVLTAMATDSNGDQRASDPVTVFVTKTSGAMLPQVAEAPANVNLTTEGVSDWVHWGLYTENSIDRKLGVAPQIGDMSIIGEEPSYSFWDNATAFTWTDGQPNVAVTATPTGVYVVGLSNGFQLTVPADPNPRTLKVYVGSWAARGKFMATLSDYSAPVLIDRSVNNLGNGPASVYTLNYASATSGQTLTIKYTCDQMHDLWYGNVTLQAATLVSSVNPLYLSLNTPTNDAVFAAPANVPLQASLSGGDGSPRTVEFFQGEVKLGQDSSAPYTFNWAAVAPGTYTLTARTTNSLGVVQSSQPVRAFVAGSGGTLAGGFSPATGAVNLTGEGAKDWAHWGLIRKNSFNRKLNVPQQISNFTPIGKGRLDQYGDNFVNFSWSDGTPTQSVAGTSTGVFIEGLGSGYELVLPADRTLRRLKLYVGLFAARGGFEATLSDSSAAPFIHSFQSVYNNATAVYTIDYAAASAGQTLTIRYTSKTLFDESWGNITLQAATLTHLSPVMNTVSTAVPGSVSLSFSTETGWNYLLEYTESLSNPVWLPLTNSAGTGSSISFVESTPSISNRFYRVRMSQ